MIKETSGNEVKICYGFIGTFARRRCDVLQGIVSPNFLERGIKKAIFLEQVVKNTCHKEDWIGLLFSLTFKFLV